MSNMAAWKEWLRLHAAQFIGGEIQEKDLGRFFRGPITHITIKDNVLTFTTPWAARMIVNRHGQVVEPWTMFKGSQTWPYSLGVVYGHPLTSLPQKLADGRVTFTHTDQAITLFPRGGEKLNPARIRQA